MDNKRQANIYFYSNYSDPSYSDKQLTTMIESIYTVETDHLPFCFLV